MPHDGDCLRGAHENLLFAIYVAELFGNIIANLLMVMGGAYE